MNKYKFLVRPVQENDLIPLCDIASKVGTALPTLPKDKTTLEKKIQRSLDSFSQKNSIAARLFFFVLEDLEQKKIVATSAVQAQTGYYSPFYSYYIESLVQKYQFLTDKGTIEREQRNTVLYLSNRYQEASLLCSLYVDPAHRSLGQGSLMSRIRYLFVAEFSDLFSDYFIAEMRGIFDEKNQFPFWEGLGRHFYDMEINEAERLLTMEGSQIISDLNPKLPIYVSLLPITSQQVIGKVHDNTKPALHVLEKEGFSYCNHIDVFDGGPIVEINKKDIHSIKTSQTAFLTGYKKSNTKEGISQTEKFYIVCNAKLNFLATLTTVEWQEDDEVCLEKAVAELLGLSLGDKIRLVAFR